ncbi:hypothetical protein [Catenovulum maritimum]|uniref:Uncharacterized protein n=1 Tax=Catenovulum maritimum TaxID=1513271 RepID=A0A0J8GRN2_9ALTE|nr:hypothetical protein [Catenovulum maritimum]KMT65475.1 hypothetical protein XM47_08985 [Catenovulum maritimum]
MISKQFKTTQVAAAVLSILLISACSEDVKKPSDNRESTPEKFTFSQSGTSKDLNYTSANQVDLSLNEFNGTEQIISFKPDQLIVSGLGQFKKHTFELIAADTITVPNPSACPSDDNYMVNVPYKHTFVRADVKPTKAGTGVTGSTAVTSVIDGDEFSIDFLVPNGFYNMSYQAGLEYAGEKFDFALTTPSPSDIYRDDQIEFDWSALEDKDGNRKVVADGQTILIKAKTPIQGLSNYYKSEFSFVSDMDTLIGETEDNKAIVEPVAKISIYSTDDFKDADMLPYSACGQNGDYLQVAFNIPDYTYDQTYRAQLTWDYEVVDYEMIQSTDDEGANLFDDLGNPIMEPKRDERGIPVVIGRTAKTQIIPFEVVTASKDTVFDTIDPDYFIDDPRNSGAELSTSEQVVELIYTVNLQGYNSVLPVSVSATDADGNPLIGKVLYSIDGQFFSDAAGAEIAPGQNLLVKVISPETFVTSIKPSLAVGDETFTWVVKTKADPSLPVLSASFEYPAPVSATASNSVILRGKASLNTSDALTEANLLINGNPVTTYDSATGIWTYQADITSTAAGDDIEFILTSDVDDSITPFDAINLKPLKVSVRKLADKDTLFPENAGDFKDLVDVAIDGRGGFPVFYLGEKEGKQVTEFKMVSSPEKLTAPLELFGANEVDKKIGGLTINNYRPAADGNYLIRHGWQGPALRVSDLSNYPNLKNKATPDAYIDGLSNTLWDARQTVMSEDGVTIYASGNDGLATYTLNYNLEGTPLSQTDTTTHRKWVSKKTFGTTSNYSGTVSTDLLYIGEGENRKEYIITLAQSSNDTGNTAKVFATIRKDIYNESTPLTELSLVDIDDVSAAKELPASYSIAVDNANLKAYIAFGNQVAELDLSNITAIVDATPSGGAATENTTVKILNLQSTENTIGELSSIVTEGGLPYLVATDKTESALYAIDQHTGEVVYLLQASNKD